MKQIIKILTGIFILTLLFAGCKKDKDKEEGNYFKVEDEKIRSVLGSLYLLGY